jgi:cytidylate kinase
MIITIDGPSVSGKSTIARMLAQELDYFYLNSGMLYRGFAYAVLQNSIDPHALNDQTIARILTQLKYVFQERALMLYDGVDITSALETKEIDQAASKTSALPIVRKHIDAWQHLLTGGRNCVVDGRDSGSVVFVHADYKFYVTASDEIRAKRWLKKQLELGKKYAYAYALEQIQSRDRRDMQRATAPLVVPAGATMIMNDGDDPKSAVQLILKKL